MTCIRFYETGHLFSLFYYIDRCVWIKQMKLVDKNPKLRVLICR